MTIKWTRVVLAISILVLGIKKGWVSLDRNIALNEIVPPIKVTPTPKAKQPPLKSRLPIVEVESDRSEEDEWSEVSIAATSPAAKKAPKCNTPKDKFSHLMYVQGLGGTYCDQTLNQNRNKYNK